MYDPVETIKEDGYKIEIFYDHDSSNPLTEWNDEIDGIVKTSGLGYGYDFDDINGGIDIPDLTRDDIKKNIDALCGLLNVSSLIKLRDFVRYDHYGDAVELVNEAISCFMEYDLSESDNLEFMSEVLTIAGIPNVCTSAHGHCQGDYHEILVRFSPETDLKQFKDYEGCLKSSADEYSDWRYGNVHGYAVSTVDEDGDEIDHLGSCWGYIGSYMSDGWNYMLAEAQSAVDYDKNEKAKLARVSKISEWAKSRYFNRHCANHVNYRRIVDLAQSKYGVVA